MQRAVGSLLSVGGRGNFPAFSSGPGNRLRQPVGPRVQAQQANDRTLRLRQLGLPHRLELRAVGSTRTPRSSGASSDARTAAPPDTTATSPHPPGPSPGATPAPAASAPARRRSTPPANLESATRSSRTPAPPRS